jgi:hypothetical protein
MFELIRCQLKAQRVDREVHRAYAGGLAAYQLEYNVMRETDQTIGARLDEFGALVAGVGFLGGAQQASLEEDDEHAFVMVALTGTTADLSANERAVLGAILVDKMTLEEAASFLGNLARDSVAADGSGDQAPAEGAAPARGGASARRARRGGGRAGAARGEGRRERER